MKIRSLLTAAICAVGALGVSALESPVPDIADTLRLSVDQCVEIALNESPQIKIADLEVKRLDYSKKETLASLFPNIDFATQYQRSIELQTLSMDFGGQSQKIKMGQDNMWNLGFTATMPLINASLWKAIGISNTQILQALESSRASRLNMAANIRSAYYALMLAIASRDVIRTNYDNALFTHEVYQKQFEQGTASEYDVLRSSVQVKNVEPELLQADIAVRQCQLQLQVLMGIDTKAALWPSTTLTAMRDEMKGYLDHVNRDLSGNTSLRSIDLQYRLAKQNTTLKKFAYIPSLGVQYGLNWSALSNGNALKNQDFNPYSSVALSLSVPIFSGGARYNAVRQARVQARQLEFQREDLLHSLNMQVSLAIDNINKQLIQIDSSQEGVAQADKAYEIMQKSFDIGAATYLNLRDAEYADTAAKLGYLQAIYNYLESTSQLDLLLGKDLPVRQ